MNFASDNVVGASRPVMDALLRANEGAESSYGADSFTTRATARLAELFAHEVIVFMVATGTAANALALASLCPPWGAVFCHHLAHVANDECGAPEMFTAGAKVVGIGGEDGRIAPDQFRAVLQAYPRGPVRRVQPGALSLSQATEMGTLYSVEQIAGLCNIAHEHGICVHMDGARFSNAVAALGCRPADMTWKAGIDVLCFGASKNGALACEAVVFFDPARADDFAFRAKRAGHILSKGRLFGAQMLAYLEDDHWLDLAHTANTRAQQLADLLTGVSGVRLAAQTPTNQVFVVLPRGMDAALRSAGARYHEWDADGFAPALQPSGDETFVRLVTSFATSAADIEQFVSIARGAAA